jgi:hypothetical protein
MDETPRKRWIYVVAEDHAAIAFQRLRAEANVRGPSTQNVKPVVEVSNRRFLASTSLPYHDQSNNQFQYGVCCKGCQSALEKGLIASECEAADLALRDRIYSREEFLEHFR